MAVYLGVPNNGTFITSDEYKLQDSAGINLIATPSINEWNVVIDNVVYRVNINLDLRGDK